MSLDWWTITTYSCYQFIIARWSVLSKCSSVCKYPWWSNRTAPSNTTTGILVCFITIGNKKNTLHNLARATVLTSLVINIVPVVIYQRHLYTSSMRSEYYTNDHRIKPPNGLVTITRTNGIDQCRWTSVSGLAVREVSHGTQSLFHFYRSKQCDVSLSVGHCGDIAYSRTYFRTIYHGKNAVHSFQCKIVQIVCNSAKLKWLFFPQGHHSM